MIEVICNSNCPKSRAILEYLDEHNVKFTLMDLAKQPLSVLELKNLVKKLNLLRELKRLQKFQLTEIKKFQS